jgi:hypothetical protein
VGGVSIEAVAEKAGDKVSPFSVMLDGVVHGPFKRVVLLPMYEHGPFPFYPCTNMDDFPFAHVRT